MTIRITPPVHPGEILLHEFMMPMDITAYGLARSLKVPRTRIERLVREQAPVTTDTALRLARYFGTSPDFWINLQTAYDLTTAEAVAAQGWLNDIEPMRTAG